MSFFSYLFGTGADKVGKTNINEYKCITRQEVLGLVSPLKVKTLSQKEEKTVEEILWERLKYFHKISLKNIRDILAKLSREHTIGEIDGKYLYKVFEDYFVNNKEN
ncbi:MAG: hypothetical protein COU28_02470 [Candidatus Magasanikbacteria bacterium CG10_big_fil_rev_8_21_14_0_10_36_16]|uniref:Uncharacterized protein n=1 Tax=Candidatus Magasanikbacteria bacterium CG10_big_fil_rev_8_21_14_0_10_36_16 TaxID=1974645 RepID=A0A2H0U0R1_9BACT|nr:MAG: hypothetical protein COU28_02470 [Candidatus Magasanikbacteria bacterium CG10_big_fil_rev_8_21_14_0_10_36_16]